MNKVQPTPIDFIGVDEATQLALLELAKAEWEMEALQAQRDMDIFAAHCRTVNLNGVEGMGQLTRNINAFAFHDWAHKEKSYDVWNDKSFNRYIDRIAPETRVKCAAPKSGNGLPLQVSFARTESPRYRKTYADPCNKETAA